MKKVIDYPVFRQEDPARTAMIMITTPPVNEHQFERMPSDKFQRRAGITSQYARAARQLAKAKGIHLLDFWSIIMRKVGWTPSMGYECCCDHIPYEVESTSPSTSSFLHIPGCCHASAKFVDSDYELMDFLTDGLHLTKLGYDVLFQELVKLIKHDIPDCAPGNLPFVLPEWREALQQSELCS